VEVVHQSVKCLVVGTAAGRTGLCALVSCAGECSKIASAAKRTSVFPSSINLAKHGSGKFSIVGFFTLFGFQTHANEIQTCLIESTEVSGSKLEHRTDPKCHRKQNLSSSPNIAIALVAFTGLEIFSSCSHAAALALRNALVVRRRIFPGRAGAT